MAFNKNPPWQRNAGMQAIVSFPQATQPVFNQNIGLQQQQNLSLLPQMGLQQQHLYPQTVQYPTSRPINTMAFQNQSQSQPSVQMSQSSSKFNPNQRVFSGTGHVTKVQNDFGFIDEEVFFHKNVCKGSFPKVGDRVLVEAAYNQNMPFKWNATRVQVLQSAISSSSSNNSSSRHVSSYGSSHMSGSERSSGRNRYSPSRRTSPDRHSHRSSNHDSRQRDVDDDDRRRRRDDRDNDRYRDKHRERTPDRGRRDRERSPVRKSSPKRRKVRPIPRYMVQMPKHILTLENADILELRRRYLTLYIPSDFFTSKIRWVGAFPPNEPFSIRKPCTFHVMHKDVEPLHPCDVELEPADADYLYSAKVMLMSTPPMDDFFQKCFTSAEDRDRYEDDRDHIHPTRLINFLVGIRGKNETMAIGGPWSPSLDGENPHSNPNVLIKTAIRTCKGLTGIDLSACTRWYRFVELYYRRSETSHKGRLIPARIETVVIFLPDVRSCQPTPLEWTELQLSYKSHLEHIVNSQNSDNQPVASECPPESSGAEVTSTEGGEDATASVADPEPEPASSSTDNAAAAEEAESSAVPTETTTVDSSAVSSEDQPMPADSAADEMEKDENDEDAKEEKPCPTNFALLDVKKLKVAELRLELEARGLPTDGIKNVLTKRLDEALQREKQESLAKEDASEPPADGEADPQKPAENKAVEEDFETMENVDMSEVTVIDEYDSTKTEEKSSEDAETATAEPAAKPEPVKLTEKERQLLEKRYSLPEQPHIIVHPSRTAKSGKFDCAVMSLSVLLDYRSEDSKEHSFEVSFFAELFNEMLTRDFGFHIYQALYRLPSKAEEETKKDASATGDESTEGGDSKKANGGEDKSNNDDEDTKAKADSRDSRKRSRFDDPSDDDRRRREKEKEKDRVKLYTADRDLLLSFSYFDVSHCGYIFEKDIEDLFYTIGLNLSRSQIRKVLAKAVTRDSLYYRKLTDKPQKNIEETAAEDKDKEAEDSVSNADEPVDSNPNESSVEAELDEIAIGNTNYIEQIKDSLKLLLKSEDTSNAVDDESHGENNMPQTLSGLVLHEGSVLNIPKLLKQMKHSEKTREDAEQQLLDIRRQNVELVRSNSKANEKVKDQSADIKSLTRKLIDAEQNLREITKKSNEYFSALSNIYDRVSTVVHRPESKRSSSIASSKRGSSRDTSNRKETKSKAVEPVSSKESVSENSIPDVQKMEDDAESAAVAGNDTKPDAAGKTSEEPGNSNEPTSTEETTEDVEMEQK